MQPDRTDDRKLAETLRDPVLACATAAMHRADRRAHRRAAKNGTSIPVFEAGKVVCVRVDENRVTDGAGNEADG